VISPLLANIALHGMEEALGITYKYGGKNRTGRAVVRYADDFVVFCESRQDAEQVIDLLRDWLAVRGLRLSEEKTRIVHLNEGFDFLGFNVKHYKVSTTRTGYKLLIKPSKASVTRFKTTARAEWLRLRGHGIGEVLKALTPLVRGWANYYRAAVAKHSFNALDQWMYEREYRYARFMHPHKPWHWIKQRYWGRYPNAGRNDHWVFGDKHTGAYLPKLGWTRIERHVKVKGTAAPDDPALAEYWARRNRKLDDAHTAFLPSEQRTLARIQRHVCPLCGERILNGEEIHVHHVRGRAGGDGWGNKIVVHLYCHQQIHRRAR